MEERLGSLEGVLQQLRTQLGEQAAAHQAAMAEMAASLQASQSLKALKRVVLVLIAGYPEHGRTEQPGDLGVVGYRVREGRRECDP
eukprot:1012563-Amphidinium_carterae.7